MKTIAMVMGSLLAAAATSASAQIYYERSYDRYGPDRWANVEQECWNPRAGHFERVRPGEYQGDLDMYRCRVIGERVYERRRYEPARQECWNPRARHFEEVRHGEIQDDLDFGRCRVMDGYGARWR